MGTMHCREAMVARNIPSPATVSNRALMGRGSDSFANLVRNPTPRGRKIVSRSGEKLGRLTKEEISYYDTTSLLWQRFAISSLSMSRLKPLRMWATLPRSNLVLVLLRAAEFFEGTDALDVEIDTSVVSASRSQKAI